MPNDAIVRWENEGGAVLPAVGWRGRTKRDEEAGHASLSAGTKSAEAARRAREGSTIDTDTSGAGEQGEQQ